MKELEREGEKDRAERAELKRQLKEAGEREERALRSIHHLEDQVRLISIHNQSLSYILSHGCCTPH